MQNNDSKSVLSLCWSLYYILIVYVNVVCMYNEECAIKTLKTKTMIILYLTSNDSMVIMGFSLEQINNN